jgi:hypothetical protein
MSRAKTKHRANLLIFSSLSIEGLTNYLSREARQAYFLRNHARLKHFGERLIDLSPKSEHLGRYYSALAVGCQSPEQASEVKTELQYLSENSPSVIRPMAITALAGTDIASGKVSDSTWALLLQASALSKNNHDFVSFIQAQSQLSLLCSIDGNHKESLQLLRGLQPIIRRLDESYNVIKADYQNSVAHELNLLGKTEAARGFASYVLRSPYIAAYPEWQATFREIYVNKSASRSFVTVNKNNVLQFPIKQKAIHLGEVIYRYNSKDYHVRPMEVEKLTDLCQWIDDSAKQGLGLENNAK